MTDVQRLLTDLGRDLAHPPTPDLASAVSERLRARRPRRPRRTRRLVLAVVLALLLPTAAIAAVPALRDVLGIDGVRVERSSRPLPPLPAGRLELGERVALARAARLVDFAIVRPRRGALATPDAVYHRAAPAGGALTLVYQPRRGDRAALTRRGLLLTMFRGVPSLRFVSKLAGPGTAIRRVTVGDGPGVWLSGRPHRFAFTDAHGRSDLETLRLAGDTLLWRRGALTLRLEGAASLAAALRIAASLR